MRRFALSLPEAEERETWETATFRVRNKIFLMFSEQERHAWIKSTHDEQRALITAGSRHVLRAALRRAERMGRRRDPFGRSG